MTAKEIIDIAEIYAGVAGGSGDKLNPRYELRILNALIKEITGSNLIFDDTIILSSGSTGEIILPIDVVSVSKVYPLNSDGTVVDEIDRLDKSEVPALG